ncbi:hypothetical protein ACLMJK_003068 [Lecanora helva]
MDIYRAIHGPDIRCRSWPLLAQILLKSQPPIDIDKATVHQLHEREPVKFFPRRAIEDIFDPTDGSISPLEEILKCDCSTCERCETPKGSEMAELIRRIKKRHDGLKILFAILIYIGHGYLIKHLGPIGRVSDSSLDSVTSHLQQEENLRTSQKILASDDLNPFCKMYDTAKDLFQPPTFDLGGPTSPYGGSYRMPFLRDEVHAQGASGEVRKFNIHEDFLSQAIKDQEWYRDPANEFKFARKILTKQTTYELDWQVERENLAVFTGERHCNIVQALCFYQWRGQINFVFPFIDGTLEKLLTGQRFGLRSDLLETADPPHHWLWAQMIGVAEGLSVIHNLPTKNIGRNRERLIGFHFDLKPANILCTSRGQLKISDFGLSLLKKVGSSKLSYAGPRGGTPRYQAPEIFRMYDGTQRTPLRSTDNLDMVKNKCDVWSYACITLEVLMYISELSGAEEVKRFEEVVDSEEPCCAFFGSDSKLKPCVEKALQDISGSAETGIEQRRQNDWATDVTELLRNMFNFNPELRPSSADVASSLSTLDENYKNQPKDELELELKNHNRKEYSKERFWIINQHTGTLDVSFIKMSVLAYPLAEE